MSSVPPSPRFAALISPTASAVSATRSERAAPNTSTSEPRVRILELDALRAIAAINLLLFHFTWVYAEKFGYSSDLGFRWPFGAYGVEMFFILSGFVNSMSLMRRGKPKDFVAARLIRIIPIFLLVIIANLWILRMPPMNQEVSIGQFLANLTLVPKVLGYQCVDPVMWTLQVEMMFYAALVVMFRLGLLRRYFLGWGILLLGSIVWCPWLDGTASAHGNAFWHVAATFVRRVMLLDMVPLFAIGFLLYMIRSGAGHRWQNLIGIIVAATVFHSIDHGKHNPAATVLIIGLVAACAYGKVPPLRFPPLVFISTISYALYLCHNNLGSVLIHRFDQAGVAPLISLAIGILFSLSLAILVTKRIEQPATRILKKAWDRLQSRDECRVPV